MLVDDRNISEKETHTVFIKGKDNFLSGWGKALDTSYAIWACLPQHIEKVFEWVENRGDMTKVCLIDEQYLQVLSQPEGNHIHVYVVNDGHPSLGEYDE